MEEKTIVGIFCCSVFIVILWLMIMCSIHLHNEMRFRDAIIEQIKKN